MIKESPHAKIKRILQILHLLMNSKVSIEYISEKTGVTTRTIYRYLRTFEETGIQVEKVRNKEDTKDLFYIVTKRLVEEEVVKVYEQTSNIEGRSNSQEGISRLLSSVFFRKKPFIEAVWGRHNPSLNSMFSQKLYELNDQRFSEGDLKKIKAVFRSIQTQIEIELS